MKKYLFTIISFAFSFGLFAQSLSVDVADYYYSPFGEQCTAYINVTNTSNQDLMFHVTRSSTTDLTNYFCWGPTCYPPNPNETFTITLTDYLLSSANVTIPDNKGAVTIEATVMPRNCASIVATTNWILQG